MIRPTGTLAAGVSDGELQVAVVRYNDRGVDGAGEHVDEQVGGDVDVGTLLLAVGVGDHERRVGYRVTLRVLHHDRPLGMHELGIAGPAGGL